MSPAPLASYTFLPWVRRGLAARIDRPDGGGTAAPRASLPVEIGLDTSEGLKTATANLALMGPGDVKGIDPRVVIRRYPRPGESDAQTGYFVAVELDQPDFPWRHTAAKATQGDRLRPWIVLVVVADDEITSREPPSPEGRLPAITVPAASLPDLAQSWAWAHVQVSGLDPAGDRSVLQILEEEPNRAIARLLCPRQLLPRTRYGAYLVPAFERGRRAALEEPLPDAVDALAPAWSATGSARLPVYDEWHFTTGVPGDFESLVRKLKPWPAPATLGLRDMDVSEPGMGLPPASPRPLQMEGALLSTLAREARTEAVAASDAFVGELRTLTNTPADLLESGGDPIVAPPLYGRWYAAQERLAPGAPPLWFNDLNADPRFRGASGLGTAVVQAEQERLMASAWEQVEGLLELQQKYRDAQLSRELAERIRVRHLQALDVETALLVTSPLHARVRMSPETVTALVRRSPIAAGALDPQLRRLSRPLGPVGKRQGRPLGAPASPVLSRMNAGELRPAPPPSTPSGIATHDRLGERAAPEWLSHGVLALLRVAPALLVALAVVLLLAALLAGAGAATAALTALAAAALVAAVTIRRAAPRLRVRAALAGGILDPEDVRRVPISPRFVPREAAPGQREPPAIPAAVAATAAAREAAARFRAALAGVHAELGIAPVTAAPLVQVSLDSLRTKILAATQPELTLAVPLRARTRLAPWVVWEYSKDPIEPPMPAPQFDQPMYEPLRTVSQDWILPGASEMPANTASLLETNQRFVEGYMLGLNHEMTRELRYHEFPIDQRGTYFRQFWDARGYVPGAGEAFDPERLRDVKPIHEWPAGARLGANSARRTPPGGEHLVLVVKGEVFRRYPSTVVYACRARVGGPDEGESAGKRVLGDEQTHPVFRGRLDPDIRFFGFELTKEAARGGTGGEAGADQGWFFVLQEQPSEPLFGLDAPEGYGRQVTSWDDLSWGDLVSRAEDLPSLGHVDLDAELPDTSLVPASSGAVWHADAGRGARGATAADLAFITLQKPFRVAIHGADLLPSTTG